MFKDYVKEKLTNKTNIVYHTWLTGGEVIRILRISMRTLQSYRDRGILPFAQIGRKIYYKASDIDEYLDRNYIKSVYQKGGAA